MKLNLLIVEDDVNIIKIWEEKLDFYNIEDDSVYEISPTFSNNITDASNYIENCKFDAIVIDIRLKSEDKANTDGNKVIEDACKKTMSLIAICTAEPRTVKMPNDKSDHIQVFQKGLNGMNIVDKCLGWLDKKQKMLSSIKKVKAEFDLEMATLFSKSMWPRWEYWLKNGENIAFTQDALKRHMATHLHATFLNEGNQKVHPEEYFFIPPLQNELDTGDLFKSEEGKVQLLITPRCELSQDKHDTLQLVTLEDAADAWQTKVYAVENAKNPGKRKSAEDSRRRFANHSNNSASHHFIPEIRIDDETKIGPFFARFNKLESIDKEDFETVKNLKESKFATLSNEFVPSLVERLGNFFSRIGDPDYDHPH